MSLSKELRDHEGNTHRDGFPCVRCRAADEIEHLQMMMLAIADQLEDGFPKTAQMLAIEFMGPDNRAKSDPHNFNNRPRLGLD